MTTQTPEPVDSDAPETLSALRPSQLRRVAALAAAREGLMNRQVFGTSVSSWTTSDLLAVADWIISGSEPQPFPAFVAFLGEVLANPEARESFERAQAEPEAPGPTWPPVDHLADGEAPEPAQTSDGAWWKEVDGSGTPESEVRDNPAGESLTPPSEVLTSGEGDADADVEPIDYRH